MNLTQIVDLTYMYAPLFNRIGYFFGKIELVDKK